MSLITQLTGWYLHFTARRNSVATLQERAERQRARLFAETVGVLQEQADFKPSPEQWSLGEVFHHLGIVEEMVGSGLAPLAQGEGSAGAGPLEETREGVRPQHGLPFEEVLRELVEARQRTLEAIASFPDPPDLRATLSHPWFGPLNVKEWMALFALHDGLHLRQIKRIKASPGYPSIRG